MASLTPPLAGPLQAMIGFAAAGDRAAVTAAWAVACAEPLLAESLQAHVPCPAWEQSAFREIEEARRHIIDGVRPMLDGQVGLFVDAHRPLTHVALAAEGFGSAEAAVLSAHRALRFAVLSPDPSEALIASALELVLPSASFADLLADLRLRRAQGVTLGPEERVLLIEAAKRGEGRALEQLILSYEPLISRTARVVARLFDLSSADADAFLQTGRVELPGFVRRYDVARGASFETYVERSLFLFFRKEAKRAHRSISGATEQERQLKRIDDARWRLRGALGRAPDDEEVAQALGIGVRALREAQVQRVDEVSLSRPVNAEGDLDYEGVIPDDLPRPDERLLARDLEEAIDRALADPELTSLERAAVRLTYFEGHDARRVARMLGLLGSQVERLLMLAVRKIARGPYADTLRELRA